MLKNLLSLFIFVSCLACIDQDCAIEAVKAHINYVAFSDSKISADEGIKDFKTLSQEKNKSQEEMIEKLILNFDLLPEVK